MQELSAIVPAKEKQTIIKTAISKVKYTTYCIPSLHYSLLSSRSILSAYFLGSFRQFRAAIQLQFDFHRAIYNLGTVLVCFAIELMINLSTITKFYY